MSFHVCVKRATVENAIVGTIFSMHHFNTCILSVVCMRALTASRNITFDPRSVSNAAMMVNGFSLLCRQCLNQVEFKTMVDTNALNRFQ